MLIKKKLLKINLECRMIRTRQGMRTDPSPAQRQEHPTERVGDQGDDLGDTTSHMPKLQSQLR